MSAIRFVGGLLAALVLIDGLATAAWGHGFVRRMRRASPDWTRPAHDFFLEWPESRLRLAAAGQALLAGLLLARSVALAAGRR